MGSALARAIPVRSRPVVRQRTKQTASVAVQMMSMPVALRKRLRLRSRIRTCMAIATRK